MKLNQYGAVNGVTVGLIVTAVLLVASLIFGIWSFSGRQKYKNDTDQLINSAVTQAKQSQQTTDNQNFAIQEQKPLIEYVGPQSYGTVTLFYPRNWSSYVDSSGASGQPIDGYFYPGTLPSVDDNGNTSFALRIQVQSDSYAQVVQQYSNLVTEGLATVTAYSLPKLPNVVGVEVVGQIENGIKGTLVILPLRTNALEVWTEGSEYLSEFDNDILPNLSFSP